MKRIAARKDRNHNEIADVFRKAGCSVWDTSQLGRGFPDMIVARHWKNVLIEVKDGKLPPSRRMLTDDERTFRDTWDGSMFVVTSVGEAVAIINTHL